MTNTGETLDVPEKLLCSALDQGSGTNMQVQQGIDAAACDDLPCSARCGLLDDDFDLRSRQELPRLSDGEDEPLARKSESESSESLAWCLAFCRDSASLDFRRTPELRR